jgi:hypothetical protein
MQEIQAEQQMEVAVALAEMAEMEWLMLYPVVLNGMEQVVVVVAKDMNVAAAADLAELAAVVDTHHYTVSHKVALTEPDLEAVVEVLADLVL